MEALSHIRDENIAGEGADSIYEFTVNDIDGVPANLVISDFHYSASGLFNFVKLKLTSVSNQEADSDGGDISDVSLVYISPT